MKPPPKRGKTGNEYSMESSGKGDIRRPNNRQRPRQQPRRRPDHYEDEYEDERPMRPRKRPRHEETSQAGRGNRGSYRGYPRDEPDPVPADRPGFISNGRFSGNRKRAEDDRSQTSAKKHYSRVVYDDEEDEEEYYDDDEEDIHEDEGNRRNPLHSNKGRRSDDYESDRKKHISPSRKQSSEFKSNNQPSKSEERPQNNDRSQGSFLRSENRKSPSKQKPDETSFLREDKEEECRNNCENDYSDELDSDLKQEQRKISSRDSSIKSANEKEIQSQVSERDRLFSSRFRDNHKESKVKQQNYEHSSRTPVMPANIKTTTQNPEPSQRYKPSLRMKPTSEETSVNIKIATTTSSFEDYSDESLGQTPKYSNFRSKGRVVPPTPLINNYKQGSTTEQKFETTDLSDSPESEPKTVGSNESEYSTIDKPLYSPRPFTTTGRRPFKQSTDLATADEVAVTPMTSDTKIHGFSPRQPSIVDEEDEKSVRKPITSGQNYRRIKAEPPQTENVEYYQPKVPITGNNFRRPSKPDETTLENIPFPRDVKEEKSSGDVIKTDKTSATDKSQLGSSNYGGIYRRVKISAISTPVAESDISTPPYENPQSVDEFTVSSPVNSNKRPYIVVRPLSNNPVVVDDNSKNVLPQTIPFRRPIKQRVQETETHLTPEDYSSPSVTEGVSDNYRKSDPNLGSSTLRQNYGYFPSKRGKIRIDDNSARSVEQYPKQLSLNQDQYTKQLPKIEITAPGPSAPDLDIATVKSNFNSGPASFSLDIPEEEYDVTLNDALQPSTLHPTRSLVDYQQTRLKPRDYQSNAGRSTEYVNRGRVSYLLPAASQQVQSVFIPEAAREAKKDTEEYEAVVLSAPSDQWTTQRRNRPTEWFW